MAKRTPLPKAEKPRTVDDPVKVWTERLTPANKDYEAWAKRYEVKRLDEYYRGQQWAGLAAADREKKYTINLIFATLETQIPTLMFSKPKVVVEPEPLRVGQPGSEVANRATLIESALQTQINKRDVHFNAHTTLALRDAYSRFGLIEVGYSADWIDNPNADKPVLKPDDTPMEDSAGQVVKQPKRVLKAGGKESIYLRRIPPQSFRVYPGVNVLEENDWAAYYEWHYVSDLKANREYQHTDDLKSTGQITNQVDEPTDPNDRQRRMGMVKVWKIWDFRAKVRHVLAEGHPKLLQEGKPFKHFPVIDLKFYELGDSWLPMPPIYNWLSGQNEINEIRESRRVHRRRFVRRYMREPSVKQAEFDKLEAGEDGVCIEVPKVEPSPIAPIPDADLSPGNAEIALAEAREDFLEITGVGGDQRGNPSSTTATQANIVNVRAQIREGSLRQTVAEWLSRIVRMMLLTMTENMQQPIKVKLNTDPFKPSPKAMGAAESGWKQIGVEELSKEIDVDVTIDVASLSPVAEEARRIQHMNLLTLLSNQAILTMLTQQNPEAPDEPPPILRDILSDNGYKSDQAVKEWWRVLQAVKAENMMMQTMAAIAKSTGGIPNAGMGGPGVPGMTPGSAPGGTGQPLVSGQPSTAGGVV